ncbi:hypothetical protein J7U39_14415 [Rhizobium sp. NLR16a]|nr:hypothetical protein J7U39_14415 [Rhizobium sp. NLR16a]
MQGGLYSDLSPLGQFQCILNVDAKIPDRVLDLGMAKQDLDRRLPGLRVRGGLRSPQGMRPVILPTEADRRHPLIYQSGVLPSTEMITVVDPTGKGIVIDCSSPSLKPGKQTSSNLGRDFELHGPSSLLLDDHCASSNFVPRDESPDFQFYQIAAAELAVDGEIEKRAISHPSSSVEEETDCPDLALLEGLLDANFLACVPSRSTQCGRIILRDTHSSSPMATVGQRENAHLLVI